MLVVEVSSVWTMCRVVLCGWLSYMLGFVFFFFKQKTAYEIGTGDWSSDVCSSDLGLQGGGINFDAKIRRNSTDTEDIFLAHIGGADVFARADRKSVV